MADAEFLLCLLIAVRIGVVDYLLLLLCERICHPSHPPFAKRIPSEKGGRRPPISAYPKDARLKSYVWVFMTGEGYRPALWYALGPGRNAGIPKEFLAGGPEGRYLQTDGYEGYYGLEGITNVCCLAHIRRKLYDASKVGDRDMVGNAGTAVSKIDLIFREDTLIREELRPTEGSRGYYGERLRLRKERITPLLDDFYSFLEGLFPDGGKKAGRMMFEKAACYALKLKPFMYNFLLDGRLSLSNNDAERAVKPYVLGRKNWLFSDTGEGAKATCLMYSVCESATRNGLDAERYFAWLFRNLPEPTPFNKDFDYTPYLPWSDSIPDEIKAIARR